MRPSGGRVGRRHRPQIGEIVPVKREDSVETPKILGLHLARTISRNVHAVAQRRRLGTPVGRAANMPVARASRIHPQRQTGTLRLGAQRGLGQRRPADIAETDEQD